MQVQWAGFRHPGKEEQVHWDTGRERHNRMWYIGCNLADSGPSVPQWHMGGPDSFTQAKWSCLPGTQGLRTLLLSGSQKYLWFLTLFCCFPTRPRRQTSHMRQKGMGFPAVAWVFPSFSNMSGMWRTTIFRTFERGLRREGPDMLMNHLGVKELGSSFLSFSWAEGVEREHLFPPSRSWAAEDRPPSLKKKTSSLHSGSGLILRNQAKYVSWL